MQVTATSPITHSIIYGLLRIYKNNSIHLSFIYCVDYTIVYFRNTDQWLENAHCITYTFRDTYHTDNLALPDAKSRAKLIRIMSLFTGCYLEILLVSISIYFNSEYPVCSISHNGIYSYTSDLLWPWFQHTPIQIGNYIQHLDLLTRSAYSLLLWTSFFQQRL